VISFGKDRKSIAPKIDGVYSKPTTKHLRGKTWWIFLPKAVKGVLMCSRWLGQWFLTNWKIFIFVIEQPYYEHQPDPSTLQVFLRLT